MNQHKKNNSKAAGLIPAFCFLMLHYSFAQVRWINVDTAYAPLPATVQVFKTNDSLDGKPFIAYYVKAKLSDKQLNFTVDTVHNRRLTPREFYEKLNKPLLVVNGTFFSFSTHQNLNVVIKSGKLVGFNVHSIPLKGKDTFLFKHVFGSAIGITKRRKADIAWIFTDSAKRYAYASQFPVSKIIKDSIADPAFSYLKAHVDAINNNQAVGFNKTKASFEKWKVQTAIGGGPVLVQQGAIRITNEEELKFTGKAIDDYHPRTSMGYTKDGYLIVLVIQGRFPGIAAGATLKQLARLMIDLHCEEAINLDGGGSSCLLVNGKETIKPSDKTGQRAVPAVFVIK